MPSNETRAYLIFQAAVAIAAGAMADPAFAPKSNETLADWAIAAATPIYDKTIGALPEPTPNYIRPKEPERDESCSACMIIGHPCRKHYTPPPSEEGIPEQQPIAEPIPVLVRNPVLKITQCMHGKPIAGECKHCEEMLF